jgi:hypothetical protein
VFVLKFMWCHYTNQQQDYHVFKHLQLQNLNSVTFTTHMLCSNQI